MEARLSKVEEVLTRLADIQARQEDRLIKVEERLEEHDKKFNAILEELSIHRVKLEEHDKKFNEIIAEIKDLRKVTNELTASMGTIGRRLGKDMEKMVLKIYRDQLMQLGIETVHIDEDALIKTDELGINVIYGNIVKD
jgi:DNA repair exonuclease SbcCD ATPase subunit